MSFSYLLYVKFFIVYFYYYLCKSKNTDVQTSYRFAKSVMNLFSF